MKKMLLVMVIAALLAAGCTEGSEEEIRRIASPFGDPLPGRIYYLAALLFATTAFLFALGFAAAKVLLSEKVTGKHLLALTWVLVAMGVGWILTMMSGPTRLFWTQETMEVSWPVVLSGLTAGGAFARLAYGRWIAFLPPLLSILGMLWGISILTPRYV